MIGIYIQRGRATERAGETAERVGEIGEREEGTGGRCDEEEGGWVGGSMSEYSNMQHAYMYMC